MNDQSQDDRQSLAPGQQQHAINHPPSPTSAHFAQSSDMATPEVNLSLDQQTQQQFAADSSFDSSFADNFIPAPSLQQTTPSFSQPDTLNPTAFDSSTTLGFSSQSMQNFLPPNPDQADFALFSASATQSDHFNSPLFESSSLGPVDLENMASPQSHHSPGSTQHSPSFPQPNQFSSPHVHSRNVSLGPEAALMPGQLNEWSGAQFQNHRRTPSEYSDVSSVAHSPNIITHDNFDDGSRHSPLNCASDGSMYQEVLGIGSFTLGDHGRSPSHSPAISPRITPQDMPDQYQVSANPGYNIHAYPTIHGPAGNFVPSNQDISQMAAPAINIDFAPTNNTRPGGFGNAKSHLDQDSLAPPERGRSNRPRSVTDPFQKGAAAKPRPNSVNATLGSNLAPRQDGSSRSLSRTDNASSPVSRRRQSTSAVPNNVIALRLADPEYQGGSEGGSLKRVQKHPATFQCTLCPKRFTRAYNLRSHLRTHTDERPFVCTVCGKAFARQHDRKRHESLHSGEKKFVCKGDLKAGGQWGCGRRFARADALGRHFRSEAGRVCIKPLLDEELIDRQSQWQEPRLQHDVAMGGPSMGVDAATGYPVDGNGNYALPAALLAQYPALASMTWSATEMSGMEDDLSGRSSFDASDYEEADETGFATGSGTGFDEGGMSQAFGEVRYDADMNLR